MWPPPSNFSFRLGSDVDFTLPSTNLYSFVAKFDLFRQAADIELFEVKPGVNENEYSYKFRHVDGRVWNQVLEIPEIGDVKMTFDIADKWAVSEFAAHREVRDLVISLVREQNIREIRWRKEP